MYSGLLLVPLLFLHARHSQPSPAALLGINMALYLCWCVVESRVLRRTTPSRPSAHLPRPRTPAGTSPVALAATPKRGYGTAQHEEVWLCNWIPMLWRHRTPKESTDCQNSVPRVPGGRLASRPQKGHDNMCKGTGTFPTVCPVHSCMMWLHLTLLLLLQPPRSQVPRSVSQSHAVHVKPSCPVLPCAHVQAFDCKKPPPGSR